MALFKKRRQSAGRDIKEVRDEAFTALSEAVAALSGVEPVDKLFEYATPRLMTAMYDYYELAEHGVERAHAIAEACEEMIHGLTDADVDRINRGMAAMAVAME